MADAYVFCSGCAAIYEERHDVCGLCGSSRLVMMSARTLDRAGASHTKMMVDATRIAIHDKENIKREQDWRARWPNSHS